VKRVSSREELEASKPHYVYFANTSSCLRRSVWERIPFRDVDFGEDVDWAERVLLAGYTIVYEPDSAVFHSHDYTLREQMRQHYDYGRMVRSADLAPTITLRQSLKTFLVSLRDDFRYVRRNGLPLRRCAFSIPFHACCVLGRWLGEHSDGLPRKLHTSLSRQGAIKDQ
jgi:rhamnosyltransferase